LTAQEDCPSMAEAFVSRVKREEAHA
jgi:hypothetical protein